METKKIQTTSPYVITQFTTQVGLHPNQMKAGISESLKSNLISSLQNKNFKDYGFISKIYNITETEGGLITPENSLGAAIYNVKFTCKLCRPLVGGYIICKVSNINKEIAFLENGPITCIVTMSGNDQVNKKNFLLNESKMVWMGKRDDDVKFTTPIVIGSFIKVKCAGIQIRSGVSRIMIWGILDSIASKSESNEAIIQQENDKLEHVNYDEYIENDVKEDELEDEQEDDRESKEDRDDSGSDV
jgi:DNA-directed RNA polymerase subunit E'/Rpb7